MKRQFLPHRWVAWGDSLMAIALSVIVPTYNERKTISPLVERLVRALGGIPHEILFVDDSTDGTDRAIAELMHQYPSVLLVHREGRLGLASAVVEGIARASGARISVLDGDLQHPPEALTDLLQALDRTQADLVIASRYVAGGSYEILSPIRRLISVGATLVARALLSRARSIADPLSGFFVLRKEILDGIRLAPIGYKILLEILVRAKITRVTEVPYRFDARQSGQSKLTLRQQGEFLRHLVRLVQVQPDDLRLLRFGLVGASGVVVNMGILWALTVAGMHYLPAGVAAVGAATTWNFMLNNRFTWAERRSLRFHITVRRYLQYWMITGLGSILQLILLAVLTSTGLPYLASNMIGIGAAIIWNFQANGRWTWGGSPSPMHRTIYEGRRKSRLAEVHDGLESQSDPPDIVNTGDAVLAASNRRAFVRYLKEGPLPSVMVRTGRETNGVPEVTIIIPTADGEREGNLVRLLDQLDHQTCQRYEVIVVCGDHRQGRAINIGAAMARSELLVTMDDDTRLGSSDLLEKLVCVFSEDRSIGIAGVANLVPSDAPWVARRAMRELPRRSSPLVDHVTDSDMAEHPCLAIRKSVFYQAGGEHEWIPRGLDPYLRQEIRRLGFRVVVIPDVWIHHLLPQTLGGILRQYFRNGVGAAYVQKFYPQFVVDQALTHRQAPPSHTTWTKRAMRYAGRMLQDSISIRWIHVAAMVTYALGYAWGRIALTEDAL